MNEIKNSNKIRSFFVCVEMKGAVPHLKLGSRTKCDKNARMLQGCLLNVHSSVHCEHVKDSCMKRIKYLCYCKVRKGQMSIVIYFQPSNEFHVRRAAYCIMSANNETSRMHCFVGVC